MIFADVSVRVLVVNRNIILIPSVVFCCVLDILNTSSSKGRSSLIVTATHLPDQHEIRHDGFKGPKTSRLLINDTLYRLVAFDTSMPLNSFDNWSDY